VCVCVCVCVCVAVCVCGGVDLVLLSCVCVCADLSEGSCPTAFCKAALSSRHNAESKAITIQNRH